MVDTSTVLGCLVDDLRVADVVGVLGDVVLGVVEVGASVLGTVLGKTVPSVAVVEVSAHPSIFRSLGKPSSFGLVTASPMEVHINGPTSTPRSRGASKPSCFTKVCQFPVAECLPANLKDAGSLSGESKEVTEPMLPTTTPY